MCEPLKQRESAYALNNDPGWKARLVNEVETIETTHLVWREERTQLIETEPINGGIFGKIG